MASLFWVGGSASWDATIGTKWATTSGGAGGAAVPTAADDVFFDPASGAVTITLTNGIVCRSLNCTGFTGTVSQGSPVNIAIGDATAGAGSIALKLVAGMTYSTAGLLSSISFVSTSATVQTVDFAGKATGNVDFNAASNGSWQYTGTQNTIGPTSSVTLTKGTLDLNGQTLNIGLFSSSGTNTRKLIFGTGTAINLSGSGTVWDMGTPTNLTTTAGTETITCTGSNQSVNGGAQTYNNIIYTLPISSLICNSGSWANVTVTGAVNKTSNYSFANFTVRSSLTINGNSLTNRIYINNSGGVGNLGGGTVTMVGNPSVTLSNIDWQDIRFSGAYTTVSATNLGDGGGNTGLPAFVTPVTRYAVAAGSWSDTAVWSSSSGGASGASVPMVHDSVFIDGNSGVGTISIDMPRTCADLTCTGYTGTLISGGLQPNVYGNFKLTPSMTINFGNTLNLFGRGSQTITMAGKTLGAGLVVAGATTGSYTMQDTLIMGTGFSVNSGIFNTNNFNISCTTFSTSGNVARTLNLGTSTITMTSVASGNIVGISTTNGGTTVNGALATFLISNPTSNPRIFAGGNGSFGVLQHTLPTSSGSLTITGTNTFGTINYTGSSLGLLTLPAATVITNLNLASYTTSLPEILFQGNETITNFNATGYLNIIFTNGSVITCTVFTANGAVSGSIVMRSSVNNYPWKLNVSAGYSVSNVDLKDSDASGSAIT